MRQCCGGRGEGRRLVAQFTQKGALHQYYINTTGQSAVINDFFWVIFGKNANCIIMTLLTDLPNLHSLSVARIRTQTRGIFVCKMQLH